jgi:hypothetical protein
MNGNGCLEPSRNDFEQMIALLRQRLRPTHALTLAEWLRVYLGLSSAADELQDDFLPFPLSDLPFDSGFYRWP